MRRLGGDLHIVLYGRIMTGDEEVVIGGGLEEVGAGGTEGGRRWA